MECPLVRSQRREFIMPIKLTKCFESDSSVENFVFFSFYGRVRNVLCVLHGRVVYDRAIIAHDPNIFEKHDFMKEPVNFGFALTICALAHLF